MPMDVSFQPVGNYETRHLTGGALVKHPGTASSCFRRPGGRLEFGQGGTWHEETPLESAERRGTVRGSLKVNRASMFRCIVFFENL